MVDDCSVVPCNSPTILQAAAIDPIGDALKGILQFAGTYWPYLLGGAIILLVVFFIKRNAQQKGEPNRSSTRRVYVSKGGETQSVEVEDTEEEENTNEDDTMAKGKSLVEVWQCSACESTYDTKKEAKEDECDESEKEITKMYQCDECEELYDNPFRAEQDDECEGKFNFDEETFHLIDGKLQIGHMKCLNKDCGWEGSIDDTEGQDITSNKAVPLESGDLVYTTSATDVDDVKLNRCPECASENMVFVPKTKAPTTTP